MWGYQESDAPDPDRPFSSKPQNALSFQRERRRCAVRSAIEYVYINVVPFFLGHRREKTMHCAFCKRSQDVVEKLISSPNDYGPFYICDQCVRVCFDAIVDAPAPSGGHSAKEQRAPFTTKAARFSECGRPPATLRTLQFAKNALPSAGIFCRTSPRSEAVKAIRVLFVRRRSRSSSDRDCVAAGNRTATRIKTQ